MTVYPISTSALIDSNEVLIWGKICACTDCPSGSFRKPLCDEVIVLPFATVTKSLSHGLHGWMLYKKSISLNWMYIPDVPESAFVVGFILGCGVVVLGGTLLVVLIKLKWLYLFLIAIKLLLLECTN